ncbi:MAG: calcium-translocating P-type ATPase, PMCA-type [Lachnospiraceae bacterium]|jgi:Ca2+-transporting ATPase|nr:calcium-translocating P-type ATPase, PMCA-type [Lachnospiraceae bacterium]
MKEYLQTVDEVIKQMETSKDGLTTQQVLDRASEYGKNRLAEGKKTTLAQRFVKQLIDPMILILLLAAIVSGVTAIYADESLADVIIIMAVVLINAVLGVVQESKAEKAIAALKEMTASVSKVRRDNKQLTVHSEELVPGDIVILEAGDSVPADGRLLECASLKIEEAALTGESLPVTKTTEALQVKQSKDIPLGDRKNMIYMGSTVVYGRGLAVITATGMNTQMGKIADALTNAKEEATPLQQKLNQLSKLLSILVLGICAVIFAVDLIRMYPDITGEGMLDTFMVSVSLAVAAIPEGLAAVVTIVLSIGVTKMSKRNAVIRKLTAVETLGCAQIICSDKTGTLTQNKMTVVEYIGTDETLLAKAMALCSDAEWGAQDQAVGEPTECALVNYAHRLGLTKPALKKEYPRIGELPFDSNRKMMSTLHKHRELGCIQFTKGAPDEVLKRCTHYIEDGTEKVITQSQMEHFLAQNKEMADRALRVLAAAYRKWQQEPKEPEESHLVYIGMTGMMDPIRPEVRAAIEECQSAGIRPIMITGDHKDTAVAIAIQLGLITSPDQAITGAALDDITQEEFPEQIERYSVYARVQPEHKVRIVNTWKDKGKITAMTGDGVNDAPSIKSADIGIGMGITGTDVTKNVADMVLADDNFATIVSAVGEGRRIYDNIRKSIQFLLASNLSEVLAIFFATLIGFTILKPVHLLWINLITDCFPALALGMEEAEGDSMKRPPRNPQDGIFSGGVGINVLLQGIIVTLITMVAYFVGHYAEFGTWDITDSAKGTTMAFLTLSMLEIFHSLNMRSLDKSIFRMKKQNKYLLGAMLLSWVCTTVVIYVPFLARAFGFAVVTLTEYAVSFVLAFLIIPIVEVMKWLRRSRMKATERSM